MVIRMDEVVDVKLNPCKICGSDNVQMLKTYSAAEQRELYHIYCADCNWGFEPQSTWSVDDIVNRWNGVII